MSSFSGSYKPPFVVVVVKQKSTASNDHPLAVAFPFAFRLVINAVVVPYPLQDSQSGLTWGPSGKQHTSKYILRILYRSCSGDRAQEVVALFMGRVSFPTIDSITAGPCILCVWRRNERCNNNDAGTKHVITRDRYLL